MVRLRLDLPPVHVRTDQARPQRAGLGQEHVGRTEEAVTDAADDAEADAARLLRLRVLHGAEYMT